MITGNQRDYKIGEIVIEMREWVRSRNLDVNMYLYGKRTDFPTTFYMQESYVSGRVIQFVSSKTGFTFRWDVAHEKPEHAIGIRLRERENPDDVRDIVKALKMIVLMKCNLIAEEV